MLLFLVFLQLPVHMFHQYEEHAHGRFRDFINQMIGGGKPILWIRLFSGSTYSSSGYSSVYSVCRSLLE